MATSDRDMERCRITLLRLEASLVLDALRSHSETVRAVRDSSGSPVRQMDCEGVLRTISEIEEKVLSAMSKTHAETKKMSEKLLKCCICGKGIAPKSGWTQGNNAEPVASGRCCDDCNATAVIPARLAEFARRQKDETR